MGDGRGKSHMDNSPSYREMRDIVIGKLVDHTIDDDYDELSEALFGRGNCFSSTEVRKRMYGMKAIIEAIEREEEKPPDAGTAEELDEDKIALLKEQQKYRDQRSAFSELVRKRSRQEELNSILLDSIKTGSLPKLEYCPHYVERSDNDLLVSLNDIHYGANVSNYWNKYNSSVCREMLCGYLDHIIDIAGTHKSENCIIWSNGDAISGNIHQSVAITNKENVIEQIMGVSELITEFLAELSKYFANVVYASVAGNHSRITQNKNDALTSERLDDLIEWYLDARLQNFENVHICEAESGFEKIDNTMYLITVRGKTYCGVHGDFDGSASKVQALQTMAGVPLYAVLSGHKHHNKIDEVQGIKTVMAGSFLGMDDYCVQKRIYGKAEQLVCVCDTSGIRCSYDIPLK